MPNFEKEYLTQKESNNKAENSSPDTAMDNGTIMLSNGESITGKEMRKRIENALTPDDLFRILDDAYMLKIRDRVENAFKSMQNPELYNFDIESIPNHFGLRDKVEELMGKEKRN